MRKAYLPAGRRTTKAPIRIKNLKNNFVDSYYIRSFESVNI